MQFGAYLIEPPTHSYLAPNTQTFEAGSGQPIASPSYLREFARHAEQLGFDAIWFPDHVVMPAEYGSRYPYQGYEGGGFRRYPFDETAFPEPLTALAYVAGATDRIRLRTGVMILPERNPVLLAKQLATLDALSGGRVGLGIGIGWLREEFEALGVPWANRGRRCDEYIEAMRALWTQEVASYRGETVAFDRIRCEPKPAQPGGIPLIMGGHSEAAARRAGRLCQGYAPLGFHGATDGWEHVGAMRRAAEEAGRDPDAIELAAGGAGADVDYTEQLAERGVDHVFIPSYRPDLGEAKRGLEEIAETLFPRFR